MTRWRYCLLMQATALDATDSFVWHRVGSLALQLCKWKLARFAFEQGLKLRADGTLCLAGLCDVLLGLGDYEALYPLLVASARAGVSMERYDVQGRVSWYFR